MLPYTFLPVTHTCWHTLCLFRILGPSYCSQNQQRSGHCVWGVSGVAGFCLVRHWFSLGLGWKVAALTVTPPPAKAVNVCEPVCGFLLLSLFFKWKYMKKMHFWFLRSLLRVRCFGDIFKMFKMPLCFRECMCVIPMTSCVSLGPGGGAGSLQR